MAYGEKTQTGPKVHSFKAHWDSDCAGPNGDTIDRGELIVLIDRAAWHAQCAEAEGYRVVESDW